MKRILKWIEEEKITVQIFLLAIGIVLSPLPNWEMLGAMFLYGVIIVSILSLSHSLYLKLKK